MAENKKSFVLYADQKQLFDKLPDEYAGKLIKHIFKYINDENPEIVNDLLLDVAFEPIKTMLKRDLKKYKEFKLRQSENGKKGGRPKNPTKPKKPNPLFGKPTESQKSLSVSVSVSVSVSEILKKPLRDFIEMRKELKKPMTERAIELLLKKLNKLSGGDDKLAVSILEQSIESSWLTIYDVKDGGGVIAKSKVKQW